MHAFNPVELPGISYGECPPGSHGSFGRDRAEVVATAVLAHMTDAIPLDEAMKNALKDHQCSLRNPAFIERPGLQEILDRL